MCITLRPYYPIVAIQHGHVHCKLYSEVIDVYLNRIEHLRDKSVLAPVGLICNDDDVITVGKEGYFSLPTSGKNF
jgi:gamma-glutamylcyclotransferase (GGCT)/AIG2-like uncharacterized protein YtfP